MKKIAVLILILYFLLVPKSFGGLGLLLPSPVRADEFEELEKKLSDLKDALQKSIAATTPLEKNLSVLEETLNNIREKITVIETDVAQKEKDVNEGEELLMLAQELLGQKVRRMYISSTQFNAVKFALLFGKNLNLTLRQFGYQRKVIENDRDTIIKVVLYIKDLENKKQELENEKVRLKIIKEETDKLAGFLSGEIAGAKKYQTTLSSQIAQLSARQQQLVAQRLAGLNLPTSLGAGPLYCTDDRKRDPGFSNAFAFFTFGIPHRVGMNQYGANGRADAGQNHEQILQSYFADFSFENRNARIKVQGYSEMDLEEYLLGIYEMPNSFHIEALKAQAIAARSYALAYTQNGEKEICTTQACQVYKGGNKGGAWEQAVKDTAGKTMIAQGQPITAWYSSTDGGYTFPNESVWGGSHRSWTKNTRDTSSDVGSFGELLDKAYDKQSPCMYAAQGWRDQYAKSAWLKSDEIADIANVILLARACSDCKDHFYQTDKGHPYGGEIWDENRVRQELSNRQITPFTAVSNISLSADFGGGRTTSVSISGNRSESYSGDEFKNWFNLRAPANIQIVGPLYNIERR